MESLCKIRDLYQAISLFETQFQAIFQISLKEGIALCTLKSAKCLTSGQLAKHLALSLSNTSKVLKSLEKKELIERCFDKEDKRKMLFINSEKGKILLSEIKKSKLELPEVLATYLG